MSKSNDSEEDDFWEEGYEPSDKAKKAIEQSYNEISRTASLSYDGEQFYVRFPKEIADIVGLNKEHKVKFTAREYPEKDNTVDIELVRSEDG